jgi:enoyl-CoA hydratase/carnithine racemase
MHGNAPAMIDLQFDGEVARLVLNRPEARNALSMAGWEALAGRLETIGQAGSRLLVLSGAEGAFCAGADLTEFEQLRTDQQARLRFRGAMRAAIDALRALPIATLAHIQGPCFGAGVALAMGCDMRLASVDARFAITPAKMGIGYPQEDVERLVSLVGPGWAARLLFTGDAIDAAQAERIGLVEGVAQDLEELVQAIGTCDPASIAMLKRGIGLARRGVAQDDEQDRSFDAFFGSDALAERLSRRRTPRALSPAKP